MTTAHHEGLTAASRALTERLATGRVDTRWTRGKTELRWADNATARLISSLAGRQVQVSSRSEIMASRPAGHASLSPEALLAFRTSGFTGLADAWIRGDWTIDDPADLLQRPARFLANLSQNRALDAAARAYLRRTTRWQVGAGRDAAATNAKFHYELPTYLFESFLDESMTYSSAVFQDGDAPDLALGQWRKRKQIIDLADLAPGADVLDVGCGWGALLRDLARDGHSATGITLSVPQADFTNDLARATAGSFEARIADYRDIPNEAYDAVFSIEMIEAVGSRRLDEYFSRIAGALRSDGRLVIQAIVTAPMRLAMTGSRETWIRRHIFPGGQLVTRHQIIEAARRVGLQLDGEYEIGRHYATTLGLWAANLNASVAGLRAHGASDQFLRMWQFYLGMSKAGFEGGDMQCLQMAFAKTR